MLIEIFLYVTKSISGFGFDCVPRGSVYDHLFEKCPQMIWPRVRSSRFLGRLGDKLRLSFISLFACRHQAPAIHVFSAAVMSAPAALAIAKLSYPELEESTTCTEKDVHIESG